MSPYHTAALSYTFPRLGGGPDAHPDISHFPAGMLPHPPWRSFLAYHQTSAASPER